MKKTINILNISDNCYVNQINKLKKNNRNINFIGPWCKTRENYFRKYKNKYLDLNQRKNLSGAKEDIKYLKFNYEIFLNYLVKELNHFHGENYNYNQWQVLLGKWLHTWITQVYYRWEYLNKVNKKYKIKNFFQLKIDDKIFIPNNTLHAHMIYRAENLWCEWIFGKILKFRLRKNLKIKYLNKLILKKKFFSKFEKISIPNTIFIGKNPNVFFYKLEADKKIKLYLFKKDKYIFYNRGNKNNSFLVSKNLRDKISFFENKSFKYTDNFNKFLFSILKLSLPRIFLEDFSKLKSISNNLNWPKKPNYILTSYGNENDDLFNSYVMQAKKNNTKTKLCILQHGYGCIFSNEDFIAYYLNKKISDIFLTWGNNRSGKNFFYPKIVKNKISNFKFDKRKKILIISYSFSSTLHNLPNGNLNGDTINKKNILILDNFLKVLKTPLRNKITIRNLNIYKYDNFFKSIKYKYPKVSYSNVNKSAKKFLNVLDEFNITIHYFVGTPFFESMTLNRPTIVIFKYDTHPEFNKEFLEFVKKFKKEKIFFDDAEKAGKFLNDNYLNLNNWWKQYNVQNLVKLFCKKYCYTPEDPFKVINNVFKE